MRHLIGHARREGSISTTIFLMATLGALRRPTVFIVMKPADAIFASVRVKVRLWPPTHLDELRNRLGPPIANDRKELSVLRGQQPHNRVD